MRHPTYMDNPWYKRLNYPGTPFDVDNHSCLPFYWSLIHYVQQSYMGWKFMMSQRMIL